MPRLSRLANAALQAELASLRETVAMSCACVHNGRGELDGECQEHQEIREQRDELLAVLNTLLRDPNYQVAVGGNPYAVEALLKRANAALERCGASDSPDA